MVSALSILGVTEIIEDVTTKISKNFGSIVSAYNSTQDNIATVANNTVVGTYNVVDNAVSGTAAVVMDTETRVVDAFNNLIDRWSMIVYDIIEIISYLILFTVIIIVMVLVIFHEELFTIIDHLVDIIKKSRPPWLIQ